MICHGCHMHMGQGAHNGSAPGKNLCTLPHSVSCQGNIVEDESWKACPHGYVYHGQSVPTSGFLDTMSMTDFMSSTPALDESRQQVRQSQFPSNLTRQGLVGNSLEQGLVHASPNGENLPHLSVQPQTQFTTTGPVQTQTPNPTAVSSTAIPVSSILTTSHPQSAPNYTPVSISVTQPTPPNGHSHLPGNPSSTIQQLEYDMQRLHLQSNGQGARPRTIAAASVQALPESYHQQHVEALRAANQQEPGQNPPQGPGALNIAALRAMPGLQSSVERQWQDLRSSIPALSAARSAQLPSVDPSPPVPSVQTLQTSPFPTLAPLECQIPGRHPSQQLATAVQYQQPVRALSQQPAAAVFPNLAPLEGQIPGRHPGQQFVTAGQYQHPVLALGQQPAAAASPKQPLYKLEYRCSPTTGRTFQVLIPVQDSPLRAVTARDPVRYEWRCDPITGQTYQVPVSQSAPQVKPKPATTLHGGQGSAAPQEVVPHHQAVGLQNLVPTNIQSVLPSQQSATADQFQHSVLVQSQQLAAAVSPQQQQVHLRGISPLVGEGGAIKKTARVIDFARRCPVKWSKLAKPDTINLPLYSYGAVTELEAALSGRGEPLSTEVLLAKICHLKNIFEVCCLNSTPTDFCSYGWQIARDYAIKVEDEVEQKFVHWHDMAPGIRTQTLLLSQMEYPRAPMKKKQEDTLVPKKDRCSTFNTCMTEMKCDYEVSNPGRTCQRKHECSWCRKNLQQGYKHQEWKCQKKQAAGQ